MTDTDTDDGPDYVAGAEAPVTGVRHLFEVERVENAGGSIDPRPEAPTRAVVSLCGAVNSYGPFAEADEDDRLCGNCERVRERREDD